jgi:ligand-binding sensor domain-containing protein
MIGSFGSGHRCAELPRREPSVSRWGTRFFLFIIVAFHVLNAQEKLLPVFHFKHLSAQNGLPLNEIRSDVVRDRDGYVWVGTANGLARFDGYGCRNYRHVPGDPYSLSSNAVMSLMLDSKGRLWVGTFETGISLYDAGRDRFLNLPPRGGDSSWYEGTWTATIMEDRWGDLVYGIAWQPGAR